VTITASQELRRAVKVLLKAQSVVVLTGAGVSAESGIDTFRDSKGSGLWSRYNPQELATPQAFSADPELVWKWYEWRRDRARTASPNPAHRVISSWENRFKSFLLVSQNVDGLHQRAGSKKIICLHGSATEVRCTRSTKVFLKPDAFEQIPPYCLCGSMFRPNIVWFGESLPPGAMESAYERISNCDALVVVGTSLAVYPAANLVPTALQYGIPVIEINVEAGDFSSRTISLLGKAGEVLPDLDRGLDEH
jgi:NAD-dependent deacetylase